MFTVCHTGQHGEKYHAKRNFAHDDKAVFITLFKRYIMPDLSIPYDTKYIQLFKGKILQTHGLFPIFLFF